MPIHTFMNILFNLKSIGYRGAVHPYLMGEPLTDKRFGDLVITIRKILPGNRILVNTNGDYLKSIDDVRSLVEAGLTDIIINLYDEKNEHLAEASSIKGVTIRRLSQARKIFFNRGGLVNQKPSTGKRPKGNCNYIFSKMCINYLGDVILCCADYQYKVVYGNVSRHSLVDIWNSEKYIKYREMHSRYEGHLMPVCSRCNRIGH